MIKNDIQIAKVELLFFKTKQNPETLRSHFLCVTKQMAQEKCVEL